MEWQAGYVSGALLVPVTTLKELVHEKFTEWGVFASVTTEPAKGAELINLVGERFDVSREAARVRLTQIAWLTAGRQGPSLSFRACSHFLVAPPTVIPKERSD